jgi:hypothetical protein
MRSNDRNGNTPRMWEIEIKPKKNIPRISDANIIKNLKNKKKRNLEFKEQTNLVTSTENQGKKMNTH